MLNLLMLLIGMIIGNIIGFVICCCCEVANECDEEGGEQR